MVFKLGDKVSVLDEDLSGVVKKMTGNLVIIETSDGFEMVFSVTELIKSVTDESDHSNFNSLSTTEILKEKERSEKKKLLKFSPKKQAQRALEVDLHIDKLIDSTKGLSNFDMLNLQMDTAKGQLEFAIRKKIQRVVFIHGVGEGVLKMELESLLRRYDQVKYYEADPRKYGIGATEAYIMQNPN